MSDKTPQDATLEGGLTLAEQKALHAMLAGASITDAAKAAGVDRTTLHRWLRHPDQHHAFRRALHRGRQELRWEMHSRLLAMASKAADCLENAVVHGDEKAALALLKGIGFLMPKKE